MKVVRVKRSYHRIAVALEYRMPVARAGLEDRQEIVLDREGVILPREDLDPAEADRLVQICDLDPPRDPRPGVPWKTGDAARGQEQADPRVLAATRLVEYLNSVAAQEENHISGLRVMAVHPAPDFPRQWFVEFDNQFMVFWGDPPGSEADGELSAEAKWTMFRDWAKRNDLRTVKYPRYLRFTKTGLVVAQGEESSEPRRVASGENGLRMSH